MSRNPYVQEISPTRWYFRHRRYWRYMAREVTSIFIGIFTVVLIVGVERLSAGPAQYQAFLAALQSPVSVIFLSLTLAFSLYNSFTWFNVAPKALPLQFGNEMAPDSVVRNAHYLIWIGLTLLILWGAH
jgi:fumarate reductase subunit C